MSLTANISMTVREIVIKFLAVNLQHGIQFFLGILVTWGVLNPDSFTAQSLLVLCLVMAAYLYTMGTAWAQKLRARYNFLAAKQAEPDTRQSTIKTEASAQLREDVPIVKLLTLR